MELLPRNKPMRPEQKSRFGSRLLPALATALTGICLVARAALGDGDVGKQCVFGPIDDGQAVEQRLESWCRSIDIARFDKWDLSIDGDAIRVTLKYTPGTVDLTWKLDAKCEPTEIKVDASADFAGRRPSVEAVSRLAASMRSYALDLRSEPHHRSIPGQIAGVALVLTALILVLLPTVRRSVRGSAVDQVRLAGIAEIVLFLPYEEMWSLHEHLYASFATLPAILLLMTFLWLVLSGFFSYGSPQRDDWMAAVPFLAALIVREVFTLHSIEEVELHFYTHYLPDKNSVVHPLFQMFMGRLGSDPYAFMMHLNGIMGAMATLPLFLFVRQRTGSRLAALVVSLFFALQPVVVRFAPTDAPYSLIFLTWFSGLVLLSTSDIKGWQLFAAATLFGIAATCRMEGALYIVSSTLLLDLRAVFNSVRKYPLSATLSAFSFVTLVGVHFLYCLPLHSAGSNLTLNPQELPIDFLTWYSFRESLFGPAYNDQVFRALIVIGAAAGLVNRRLWIGTGAALGSLIVLLPMSQSGSSGILVLHRLVPVCGLEAIAAGVGAFWLCHLTTMRLGKAWLTITPALAVALFIFAQHWPELGARYAYNEEFELLRRHLAPNGTVIPACSLLATSGRRIGDSDLHSIRQVLPEMHVTECFEEDCRSAATDGSCVYYFRSLGCYLHRDAIPASCQADVVEAANSRASCMVDECANLEQSLNLEPVEERIVYPHRVWGLGELAKRYPESVQIGLYRVRGIRQ